MSQKGMGVMLGYLGGNEETVNAFKESLNKEIKNIEVKDDALFLYFADGKTLKVFDDGQSCCESRYMQCDDDLTPYMGGRLTNIEILDAETKESDYDTHEIQFLKITTDKGWFKVSNHNEHNGYYGGFWIVLRII